MLLLNKDIVLKGNIFFLNKKKKKRNFIIPCLLMNYINDNSISIKIMINYEDNKIIKRNSNISVNIDACRIIDDYGFSIIWNILVKIYIFQKLKN